MIKQIYYIIPNENIHLFIREAEFRVKIIKLKKEEQFYEFIDLLNYIKNVNVINLFNDNYLFSITD